MVRLSIVVAGACGRGGCSLHGGQEPGNRKEMGEERSQGQNVFLGQTPPTRPHLVAFPPHQSSTASQGPDLQQEALNILSLASEGHIHLIEQNVFRPYPRVQVLLSLRSARQTLSC